MFSLEISPAIYERTSAQLRFLYENHYYKIDIFKNSGESITEELATILLKYSTLDDDDFVKYECGWCNNEHACRSKNIVKENERMIKSNKKTAKNKIHPDLN